MSQLGPVIGNRIADGNKLALKPHLRQRLEQQSCRNTPQGTVTTDALGRQSFTPNYLHTAWGRSEGDPHPRPRSAFRPGQRVRVSASVTELLAQGVYPFAPDDAAAVAGCEGVVIEDAGCAALGLVVVAMSTEPWAFMPAYLCRVAPAEGDDELAAMADYTCPF